MDGMLSQEEINALLGNVDADSTSEEAASDAVQTSSDISKAEKLTPEESDALGEISNISMGTAATTLSRQSPRSAMTPTWLRSRPSKRPSPPTAPPSATRWPVCPSMPLPAR